MRCKKSLRVFFAYFVVKLIFNRKGRKGFAKGAIIHLFHFLMIPFLWLNLYP
jgi:hypothetical protein